MGNTKAVKIVGIVAMVAGLLMIIAGGVTWGLVSSQLADENITVAEDAAAFAGKTVNGPLDAYYQADIIKHHALEATGGKTYAELDREDPLRATAMNASFLRASLFTSVVAFGVAAFAIGMGLLTILLGWAVTALASVKVSAPATASASA
ncbi:aromatic ring-opening dioxygenase LigA [Actinotalea sp. M2MS4P-6]|uniref:aromatic ring-opening dioxygenase LigA n=1 Tax=Actinotalea sp. M2MS4P-6 TaxID=2983762 RepID=UPI0021E38B59|nr:aromatic ring-opening dioxygenase LigA [Actinotalea sp. M2MS4P-6]MCV2395480.1 aromatic ring-opening dioxygenase LigA [Actinotalea sp. M2MS4P-6]